LKHHSSNVKDHFLDLGAEPLSEVDFEKSARRGCLESMTGISNDGISSVQMYF